MQCIPRCDHYSKPVLSPGKPEDSIKAGSINCHSLLEQEGIVDKNALNAKHVHHICTNRCNVVTVTNGRMDEKEGGGGRKGERKEREGRRRKEGTPL